MNRHERRAAAAKGRGQDTMGESHSFGSVLPLSVTESAAFKAGQAAAESGKLPPGYYAAIEDAARAIRHWIASEPTPPDLRWLEWDNNRVFIAAALDTGAAYLADSDDARRLLAWLDEATGRQLSLNMAGWALRLIGQIPMPAESADALEREAGS